MAPDPTAPGPTEVSLLFVCLGNICRSPLAEGVAQHLAQERGLGGRVRVDSAGTGAWHVGESPDPRSIDVARRNGIHLDSRARQLRGSDLFEHHYVLAMDHSNLSKLEALRDRNGASARVLLLRDFDPDPGDGQVPDPYYGGPDGFDDVFRMIVRSVEGLLDEIEAAGR
jgi:protein-tyrosine phosphatase